MICLEEKYKGYIVRVLTDDDPQDPRDWDNLGTMYCFHPRYILGDPHNTDIEGIKKYVEKENVLSLPLYLYDHSGISMSTGRNYPFNCRWDSMQVGYITAHYGTIRQEFAFQDITDEILKKAEDILKSEVETYNKFLMGMVYGYCIYREEKCDECGNEEEILEESCWGFFEEPEEIMKEAKNLVDHMEKKDDSSE